MLTKDEVIERLNVSPRSLKLLVEDRIVLELDSELESETTKNPGAIEQLYPEEQFTTDGLNAKLASVLSVFKKLNVSSEQIWSWLSEPQVELEELSPLNYLELTQDADKLRFIAASTWAIETLLDPSLERTDWLKSSQPNVDPHSVGDYTPTRRGGQHGA